MPRAISNWIQEYIRVVGQVTESPEPYQFWCAAAVIGAAMKRHVWIPRGTYRLFPNMYVVLIGRPGIGKGSALNPAIDILKDSKAAHFLSGRITIEWVLEKLAKGMSGPVPIPNGNGNISIGQEHALLLFSPEFDVFVSSSQHSLRILTDLWDSKEGVWDYGTRHVGEFQIADPCLSLLAGCSPDTLIELLPSASVGGGFTRRVNFVFADANAQLIPWPSEEVLEYNNLADDLRRISLLTGKFGWEPKVRILFEEYYRKTRGASQDFQDEATAGYNTTMFVHAIKLAMVISAAKSDNMIITQDDWAEATDRIDECAATVKKVFRAVGSSDFASITDRFLRYLEVRGICTRQEVLANNWQHMNPQDLDVVIATLVSGEIIDEIYQGSKVMYRLR